VAKTSTPTLGPELLVTKGRGAEATLPPDNQPHGERAGVAPELQNLRSRRQPPKVQLTLRLDADLHTRLRRTAERLDVPMTDIIEEALRRVLPE
jgi:uncharacterized protein (DUF4415 family)